MNASLTGVYEQVLVAATDGTLAADVRPLVRLSISVQVEDQGKRERGTSGGGARTGYAFSSLMKMAMCALMPGHAKRYAWHWSIFPQWLRLRALYRWCWGGLARRAAA